MGLTFSSQGVQGGEGRRVSQKLSQDRPKQRGQAPELTHHLQEASPDCLTGQGPSLLGTPPDTDGSVPALPGCPDAPELGPRPLLLVALMAAM